jgi:putative aldouronate transport system substrate-binding protein
MVKGNKIVSLMLVLMFIFGLAAGCSTDSNEATVEPSTAPSAASSSTPVEDEGDEPTGVTFPLVEPVEFSMWVTVWESNRNIYTSLADHPVSKLLEEKTNVHITYVHPASGSESESFNLMLTSQNYDDVIMTMYSQLTPTTLYEDGVIHNLTELVPQHMPNFNSLITADPAMLKDAKDDNGHILLMYRLDDQVPLMWAGLSIRRDLLDKAGLGIPETYSEWEEAGLAFKEMGVETPLFIPNVGAFENWSTFESGFGIGSRFYRDGTTIKYGPIEPGYKEYVTLMHDWYEKGIITPDFVSGGGFGNGLGIPETQDILNGTFGAAVITSSHLGGMIADGGLTDIKDMYYSSAWTPVKNKGDKVNFSILQGSGRVGTGFAITTNVSEDMIPIVMSYFDYFYSDEGIELVNYGIEGDSFTRDANGNPQYTEKINTSLVDGVKYFHVYDYSYSQFPMVHVDKERTLPRPSDIVPLQEKWIAVGTDLSVLPTLSISADDSARVSSITNDANTYVREMTVKFITGAESLDNYDNMVEIIKSMEIEQAIEVYQAALDRYNAR